ncbi:hypothetical protein [Streptomyces spectabilis]|uniref:Uncharacterized protein n=1 Tax=Streptomyces spectabilis TaxID=68270 RepID=A0A516R0X8_STRST|nr:hypothetical protein [Streptomyces spectabilis]QDQ09315.1 hypothetical protein FH965_01000 [Streptomyces spectabilis]
MMVITARALLPASGTGSDAQPTADGSVQVRSVADAPEAARPVAQVPRERLVRDSRSQARRAPADEAAHT